MIWLLDAIVNIAYFYVRTMPQSNAGIAALPSSFRDPAGFVFTRDDRIYRRISPAFVPTFRRCSEVGLYQALIDENLLVEHSVITEGDEGMDILPDQVPYISYPYEWSFSQLQAAALLTLRVQKIALAHDMTLKDASAYNVQFFGAKPKFIDTLSFDRLDATQPWAAYRQFCEHFLGPLALMAYVDPGLNKLILVHLEGVPLETVVRVLPLRTHWRYSLLVHLHLHARSQRKHADDAVSDLESAKRPRMNKSLLNALVDSLAAAVNGCSLTSEKTEWGDYYHDTNYSDEAMTEKERLVSAWLQTYALEGEIVHDMGANTGRFSTLAAERGHYVVAHDVDRLAVERHFLARRDGDDTRVLPLQLDLVNPTPAIGWAGIERESFLQRCHSGFVLALALIHHLAIGNNTPLGKVAEFFAGFARELAIEFVPKEDSQVIRMLATREDIFPEYHELAFEEAFSRFFVLIEKRAIVGSDRTLYLFERNSG